MVKEKNELYYYILKIKNKKFFKDMVLLPYGAVYIIEKEISYLSKIEYTKKTKVGTFIINNSENEILLYITTDLGDKISCEYISKDSSEIYYINGYDKYVAIDSIYVSNDLSNKENIALKHQIKNEE